MARRASKTDNPSVDGADGAPAGAVPYPLVIMAAYSWRIVVIGVVALSIITMIASVSPLVLPLAIALLITAPLERVVSFLARHGWHRGVAAAVVVVSLIVVVLGLITVAGTSIAAGFGDLRDAALAGFDRFVKWLVNGPFHVAQDTLDQLLGQVQSAIQDNAWGVASGALSFTGTIGSLFAGTVIALLALFFFLRDGRGMWLWFIKHLPAETSERVDHAGLNSWITLRRYTQTSVFVAFVDAVGIGLGAWILGLPLAFPIAIMVFLFSFIPLFGATISGVVAVAVALVDGGPWRALIMAGVVVLVQQIEGNVLYPWLFGKAASIHPMVILLTVSAGTLLAGLVGAVVAVPLVAFLIAFVVGLRKSFVVEEPPPITAQLPEIRERGRRLLHWGRAPGTPTPVSPGPEPDGDTPDERPSSN